MKNRKEKLEKIFDKIASPEEKAIYALKNKVKELEQKPIPEKVIEKTEVIKEVEKDITGEYVVEKINKLPVEPEKQVDFVHIKNFPWHLVKGSGEAGLISWGGGSLSQTLDLGNTTGGFDIVMSDGDLITGSGGQISLDFGNDAFFALTTDGGGFNTPYFTINPSTFSLAGLGSGGIDFFLGSIQISHATLIQFNSAPVRFNALSASTVPYLDASKNLVSSAVTPTELGYLSGVTSAIQTQINSKLTATLADGNIFVGSALNVATAVAMSGDATLINTGALTLATVNANVGSFGSTTQVATFTVNAKGLITAASNTSIQITESQVTNLVTDLGNKQPLDATLTAFAGLTIAANSLTIGTGADAFSQTTFAANTFPARASTGSLVAKTITDFGLSLVDDADASTARTTLGLVIGTDVQAYDADLASWAGVTRASGFDTFVATPSSANLASLVTGETGSGALVFGTSPTFTTDLTTPLIYGSSASGGDLTLVSTSNATKGNIFFGSSTYDEVNNRLGIQSTSPAYPLDVNGAVGAVTAKFGAAIPFYIIANEPTLGMNVYYNGGWKYGAGSSSRYGMVMQADTVNGNIYFALTSSAGNADDAASITERVRYTAAGNVKINGSADRGTTEGSAQLVIFNGTAPAGTLTNGVSLYSAAGKLKSADAAGTIGHVLSVSAVNNVSPTAQNRTLTVDIGGTTYYITAKTTND